MYIYTYYTYNEQTLLDSSLLKPIQKWKFLLTVNVSLMMKHFIYGKYYSVKLKIQMLILIFSWWVYLSANEPVFQLVWRLGENIH